MQRLYAMFPDRGPGIGLLLLRVELALLVLLDPHGAWLAPPAGWPMQAMWGAALLLACGALTPLALLLAVVLTAARLPEPMALLLLGLMLSVFLLGPGAYSLDARLFGRRLVREGGAGSLPRRDHPKE